MANTFALNLVRDFLGHFPPTKFEGCLFVILVSFAVLFGIASKPSSLRFGIRDALKFYAAFLLLVCGVLVSLFGSNLVIVFIGFVVSSLALVVIMKFHEKSRGVIQKLWRYFLITDLLFLLGSLFFFAAVKSFSFLPSDTLIEIVNSVQTANYFRIAIAILAVAMFSKIAIVPLHWWTLDVLDTRRSELTLVTLFYRLGIFFVFLKMFAPLVSTWGGFFDKPIFIMAVLTTTWANLVAVRAKDVRKMILYSSIAQGGYILSLFPALALVNGNSLTIIILFLIVVFLAHLGVLTLLRILSDDGSFSIDGLGRTQPGFAIIIAIFTLVLAGMPPFAGFLVRFMMFNELALGGYYLVLAIMLINTAIAVYYYTAPIVRMYLFKPLEKREVTEVSYSFVVVVAVSLLALVFIGIIPGSLIQWIQAAIALPSGPTMVN